MSTRLETSNNSINKKSLKRRIIENRQLYVFLLIPIIWLIIFKYVPMFGAQIAFKNFSIRDGIWGSKWVGLDQFKKFFKSYMFSRTVSNTLILSLYSLVTGFPISIIFALLLNSVRSKAWRSTIENVTYMPYFISTVVMVGIMIRVLDHRTGVAANLADIFGSNIPNLFQGANNFRNVYIWSGVWQYTGWNSIIYMAALSSVNPELSEAALIDGASRFKRVIHIDLPAIVPTIAITLILRFGNIMGIGFDKAFLLQNDTNLKASEVIATYVYKVGMTASGGNDYSYATAIGLFNSVINLIMITVVNKFSQKVSGSGLF